MEYWPLLTDDHMTGAQPIERQLRPPTVATAVDRTDFPEAVRMVHELYDLWGGAFMPLVPITVGEPVEPLWGSLLDATPIDRLVSTTAISDEEKARYSYASGPVGRQRLLTVLAKRPLPEVRVNVSVCRRLDSDDPWYLAYLAIIGDLPSEPNEAQNQRDQILASLTYADVVDLQELEQPPGAVDLLSQLRRPDAWTAAQLTRSELGFWSAPVNQGFSDVDAFRSILIPSPRSMDRTWSWFTRKRVWMT